MSSNLEKVVGRLTTVRLGGEDRELIFGLEAMAAIEVATGESPLDTNILERLMTKPSATNLKILLFAGLAHYEENAPTLKQIGRWVPLQEIGQMYKAAIDAFTAQAPKAKEDGATPADPPPAGG